VAEIAAGAGTQQLQLVWTKLRPPVARTRVSRPQLLDILTGPSRRLTLIRAPAEVGK
jgi:ATP/maltotriose-dependent transcriptional regulator MalT